MTRYEIACALKQFLNKRQLDEKLKWSGDKGTEALRQLLIHYREQTKNPLSEISSKR
jgi:hypothetical protein